ncbi:uncharacterized protein LOC127804536 [Diospyros lotus]|uniref:uncharacterized protein LOC127804536 n=1 Tax=Diospyros lotus TaxID=55363 RepID=UPI0022567A61|nr:uncharacterized protein LOC127804536 [Diospyros lotus]
MPMKGVHRFGVSGQRGPRYIGPFVILEQVGALSYKWVLPPQLSGIHNAFRMFMLRKYVPDPQLSSAYQTIEVREDVSYEEMPGSILEQKEKVLRNWQIPFVKLQWQHHSPGKATWEHEDEMRHLFSPSFLIDQE